MKGKRIAKEFGKKLVVELLPLIFSGVKNLLVKLFNKLFKKGVDKIEKI